MGHALKMAHPAQISWYGAKHMFDDCRGDYSGYESVYSVMNKGLCNDNESYKLTASCPQDHDQINIINKWENHFNCYH